MMTAEIFAGTITDLYMPKKKMMRTSTGLDQSKKAEQIAQLFCLLSKSVVGYRKLVHHVII